VPSSFIGELTIVCCPRQQLRPQARNAVRRADEQQRAAVHQAPGVIDGLTILQRRVELAFNRDRHAAIRLALQVDSQIVVGPVGLADKSDLPSVLLSDTLRRQRSDHCVSGGRVPLQNVAQTFRHH
jgi:hypothetical protein